ncbi:MULTISPECIES: helicase associated domain-containing protein [Parabacteroides]|uniref:helicase associated domain-containing protein n=2 Tax=Parabacteroides leei TaxID=2939491 RepID=UPI00189B25BB|nr:MULTISPECIES: helicase associated domain-containing protein [Parabacteroides]MCL3851329.1 helicase associated domain-containing protein [Parabacteroides leei]
MEPRGKIDKKSKVRKTRKPNKVSKKRNNKYRSTIAFFEKNNKWPSPTAKDPKELPLGQWIVRIRYLRNHFPERLPEKIIELVDRIDADKQQKSTEQWENNYYKLKDFVKNEKRWPLPGSTNPEENKLYNWCTTQKSMRNGILQGRLSDERIQMLDAIGFLWNKNRKKRSWNESFNMVKKYYIHNGRWPAHATDSEETRLAKWCSKMRAYKNGTDKTGKLTSSQIKKLTDLGFEWEINVTNNGRTEEQLNRIWFGRYTEFCDFITTYKRYPSTTTEKEKTLYSWWMRMAYLRRKGKLSNDRIQLLNSIGFKWGKGKNE